MIYRIWTSTTTGMFKPTGITVEAGSETEAYAMVSDIGGFSEVLWMVELDAPASR